MTKKTPLILASLIALPLLLAGAAGALPLFNNEGDRLVRIDPASGAIVDVIGLLAGDVERARGLTIHPTTLVAYLEYEDGGGNWRLGTVDLVSALVTEVGDHAERFRELAFDDTGKLWGVSGQIEANPGALLSIDPATGATTLENGSLPTIRNKLAYAPGSDTLYILGYDSQAGVWELYSLSPAAPTNLTQVALSGVSLDAKALNNGGMAFDAEAGVLLTEHSNPSEENFLAITPEGLVTPIGNVSSAQGLAFLPAEIFADGFESGDTSAWSN